MSKETIRDRMEQLKNSPVGKVSKSISDDRRIYEKHLAKVEKRYAKYPVFKGLKAIQSAMATA